MLECNKNLDKLEIASSLYKVCHGPGLERRENFVFVQFLYHIFKLKLGNEDF